MPQDEPFMEVKGAEQHFLNRLIGKRISVEVIGRGRQYIGVLTAFSEDAIMIQLDPKPHVSEHVGDWIIIFKSNIISIRLYLGRRNQRSESDYVNDE